MGSQSSSEESDFDRASISETSSIFADHQYSHHHHDYAHDYIPSSIDDVRRVRSILLVFIPRELGDVILDLAQYWPRTVSLGKEISTVHVEALPADDHDTSYVYLVTDPIKISCTSTGLRPLQIKMVRFSLRSCDQGWGGERDLPGPYHGSYTWFEAGIYRSSDVTSFKDSEINAAILQGESEGRLREMGVNQIVNPQNGALFWHIQRNFRASSKVREYEVKWVEDAVANPDLGWESTLDPADDEDPATGRGRGLGFVRSLVAGDRIAVRARALFPAWANHVHRVQTEIFYSV